MSCCGTLTTVYVVFTISTMAAEILRTYIGLIEVETIHTCMFMFKILVRYSN